MGVIRLAAPKSVHHLTLQLGADATARLHVERPATASFGRRFMVVFEDARQLLRGMRNPSAHELAHELPWLLSASDWRRLDQRVLADRLRVSQPSVSRALSELVERGFLEREGKGPGVRYRLSPRVSWRGTTAAYHAQQREEGRDYAGEAAALSFQVQLNLALPPPLPPRKEKP